MGEAIGYVNSSFPSAANVRGGASGMAIDILVRVAATRLPNSGVCGMLPGAWSVSAQSAKAPVRASELVKRIDPGH